jgi:hypothetical protein
MCRESAVLLVEPGCHPHERGLPAAPPFRLGAKLCRATTIRRDEMTRSMAWDQVTDNEVVRALNEYDRLGPEGFFAEHGFGPTTTYDLVWKERLYPPKAILGTAYEFATGQRLASGDFEGGKAGAVKVLGNLGFTVRPRA